MRKGRFFDVRGEEYAFQEKRKQPREARFFLQCWKKKENQRVKSKKVAKKRPFFRKRFPKKKNFVLTLIPYYVIMNQVACKSALFCAADLRNLNGRVDV